MLVIRFDPGPLFPASKFQTYSPKKNDSIPLATVRYVQWAVRAVLKVKILLWVYRV